MTMNGTENKTPRAAARRAGLLAAAAFSLLLAQAEGAAAQWATSTTNTSNISNTNAGNVGVGTGAAEPTERLVTKGNSLFGGTTSRTELWPNFTLYANPALLEVNSDAAVSDNTRFATLSLVTRQSGTASAVGGLYFSNSASASSDKRLGGFFTQTDGATNSGALLFSTAGGGSFLERMRISGAGNVGVGTTTPAARLHVVGAGGATYTGAAAPAAFAVTGGTGGSGNWNSSPGGAGGGVDLAGGAGGSPVAGSSFAHGGGGGAINITGGAGGSSAWATSGGGGSVVINGGAPGPSSPVTGATGNVILANLRGNVGIGTTSPTSLLEVSGSSSTPYSASSLSSPRGRVVNTNTTNNTASAWNFSTFDANGVLSTAAAVTGVFTSHAADAVSGDLAIQTRNAGAVGEVARFTGAGNVGLGTATPEERLHVAGNAKITGNMVVDGNLAAKYQDVAEWVPSAQKLAAGTVVTLDPARSNHVLASATAYDTAVAGVVSEQPGLILGEGGEGKVMVATTGRVKVKVDATKGPIKIGDLLVTSDIQGVAMRSEPVMVGSRKMHAPGTIIGKALEPLAGGVGEILVLLSMQ